MSPDAVSQPPARAEKPMEFLFLVSHGLLSPVSAIRWGTSRLERLGKDLSKEQRDVIAHVHDNAKRLSTAFTSMLLLARNEDQTYTFTSVQCPLRELLELATTRGSPLADAPIRITGDQDVGVEGDRALLEAAFHNLFAVLGEAMSAPRVLTIDIQPMRSEVLVQCTCPLELSIQEVRTAQDSRIRPVVGGTPGLLLALTSSLLAYTGGTLDMRSTDNGEYRLTLRLARADI